MPETPTCPRCGTPLATDSLMGLCPRCVFGVTLQTPLAGLDLPAPSFESHRYFGDCELLEEIARGGMGVVFKARQASLNRVVAVKMILAGPFASKESVRRFRAEAEAAARLQHPNIVAIHEVGEHHGQHFFSMDYVEGRDLAALTRDQPLPALRAARYMQVIAQAIHYAHERDILHRDLKPSNILIDSFDQPRITDFGLAKHLHGETALTLTGQVLGSPGYMAPEQASGKRGETGPPGDVYSLGAILFHLLTGRAPFVAEAPGDAIHAVLHDEPVPPRRLNSSVPADLETICLKCLEKNPAHRYASARLLADELARFLGGEPILARPVSKPAQAWRWCQRRPVVASLLAAVVLLLVALAAGSNIAAFRIRHAERLATEKLRDSYLDQARARRVSGRLGQRYESLAAISNAAGLRPSPELRFQLRNEAIACLALTDVRLIQRRPMLPTRSLELVRCNADFTLYARMNEREEISVRNMASDREIAVVPAGVGAFTKVCGFSPDSRYLALEMNPGRLLLFDTHMRVPRLNFQIVRGSGCQFDVRSRSVGLQRTLSVFEIYDLDTGQLQKTIDKLPSHVIGQCDPSWQRIALVPVTKGDIRALVEIRGLESGELIHRLSQGGGGAGLNWSDDGNRLVVGTQEGTTSVWNAQNGGKEFTIESHDGRILQACFSRSGNLIATTGRDNTIRLWDAFRGRPLLTIPGMSGQLQFDRDARLLGYIANDGELSLAEMESHPEFTTLNPSATLGAPKRICFSPNGELIAMSHASGVHVWNIASGRTLGVLSERLCSSALFSSDGRGLWTFGADGVGFWSMPSAEDADSVALPPTMRRTVWSGQPLTDVAASLDGDQIATVNLNTGDVRLIPLEHADQARVLGIHRAALHVALSPGARWVATGTLNGSNVLVWDTETSRKTVIGAPPMENSAVTFSPDGRWLVTAGEEYRLWKASSWEAGPIIKIPRKNAPPGHAAFSPDGRVLALVHSEHELYLFETDRFQVLAVLETPSRSWLSFPCFSPDGARLAAVGSRGEVHVWNLSLIRQSLATMKLDWELPAR